MYAGHETEGTALTHDQLGEQAILRTSTALGHKGCKTGIAYCELVVEATCYSMLKARLSSSSRLVVG